jgi:hypothetical protein
MMRVMRPSTAMMVMKMLGGQARRAVKTVAAYQAYEDMKGNERVQVRNAEQEEDGRDEAEHASSDRARDDTSTGNDAVVAGVR